jgi:hypothetical protein
MESSTKSGTPTVAARLGGCHCGAVRYEATLDPTRGSRCNCSICTKVSQLGTIMKPAEFRLLRGEADLSTYAWGGKISTRYFCKHCGIHCFARGHLAELGGDYVSVNLNTLDHLDPRDVKVTYWDGRHDNWHAGTRDTPWPIVA